MNLFGSDTERIRLIYIQPVLLDRPRHILPRHLSFRRERRDGRMRDVEAIHLEVAKPGSESTFSRLREKTTLTLFYHSKGNGT